MLPSSSISLRPWRHPGQRDSSGDKSVPTARSCGGFTCFSFFQKCFCFCRPGNQTTAPDLLTKPEGCSSFCSSTHSTTPSGSWSYFGSASPQQAAGRRSWPWRPHLHLCPESDLQGSCTSADLGKSKDEENWEDVPPAADVLLRGRLPCTYLAPDCLPSSSGTFESQNLQVLFQLKKLGTHQGCQ